MRSFRFGRKVVATEDEVQAILANLDARRVATSPDFCTQGEDLRVSGPFKGFQGVVQEANPNALKVVINIFGRNTPVELDFAQIEKLWFATKKPRHLRKTSVP